MAIVKVPMKTYKGKPLESYSKEVLIRIVERVWALYVSTSEENAMLIGLPRRKRVSGPMWAFLTFLVIAVLLAIELIVGK